MYIHFRTSRTLKLNNSLTRKYYFYRVEENKHCDRLESVLNLAFFMFFFFNLMRYWKMES